MTELRQKMIRAMELKNLSPHTQRAYLAAVTGLARHYRQSPVGITKEMIEDYLLLLKKSRASNSCGLVLTGLRFFYTTWQMKNCGWITACAKKHKSCPPCSLKSRSQESFAPATTSSTA